MKKRSLFLVQLPVSQIDQIHLENACLDPIYTLFRFAIRVSHDPFHLTMLHSVTRWEPALPVGIVSSH